MKANRGAPRDRNDSIIEPSAGGSYCIFIIAGEHSGDVLGGKLMAALNKKMHGRLRYLGVGGPDMEREGLVSQFPIEDVAVMGPMSILPRLPRIAKRIFRTVDAALVAEPDLVLIIDSPEFTHPIAKRIRRRRPQIPIVDYVSPTVWAWRPGRAKKMSRYVDHVLALLPFEPKAHAELGGPKCTYVGHPIIERRDWIKSLNPQDLSTRLQLDADRPVLIVLPGSRSSELTRLFEPFMETVQTLKGRGVDPEVLIPVVPSLHDNIVAALSDWDFKPHIISGDEDKFCAFRLADAALAASGTVTLELAMSGTPMVVAYQTDALAKHITFLIRVPSIVLANLVLGENIFPEYVQEHCTPQNLADALELLLKDTPEREAQLEGLARIDSAMAIADHSPSEAAADIVIQYLESGRSGNSVEHAT